MQFKAIETNNGTTTTFSSDEKYYWPVNNLDFYAYSPTGNSQAVKTDYKTFVVTPSSTVNEQVDLVYANISDASKTNYGAAGIPLNFCHTGSKIVCKVINTADNLKFDVTGWKVGYLDEAGTFTYNGTSTASSGLLPVGYWSDNTTASASNTYSSTFTKVEVAAKASTPAQLAGEMILVPQTTTATTAYADAAAASKVNGSYIAVQIKIMNTDANNTLIQDTVWAIWPVAFNWEPGKKYTYIVDLSGGGYFEENNDTDADLDQILENAIIKFVTVNVYDWNTVADTNVDM